MSETAKFLTPEQAARVDHSRFDAEKIDRPTITYWQGAWRRLKKNPLAVVAMVMLAVVLFFVLLGPTINGQEYIKINASIKNTAPNSANWFGTDTMGRDIFCRVWIGARLSLIVALVCSTIQIVVGCAYGGVMAYFGGTVDSVMMRVIEVITWARTWAVCCLPCASPPGAARPARCAASSCSCGNPSMCRRPR